MSSEGSPWEDYGTSDGPWSDFSEKPKATATPPAEDKGGIGKNFVAGFTEGLTALPSAVLDPASRLYDSVSKFLPENSAPEGSTAYALGAGRKNTNPVPQGSVTHALNKGLGLIGLNPEDVPAEDGVDHVARLAGTGATALLLPGGAGAGAEELAAGVVPKLAAKVSSRAANTPVATAARQAFTGATAGATGGLGEEAVPDDQPVLKSAVGVLASIAGGAAAEAPALARTGATVIKKFAQPMTAAGQEQIAADTIRSRATNPAMVASDLDTARPEIVTGSKPTLFQQTGDMGLGSLEREVATKNPELFAERRAAQSVARATALKAINPEGDPKEVASYFRQQLDNIDAETDAAIEAAKKRGDASVSGVDAATGSAVGDATSIAQQRAAEVGGSGTPEGYGTAIRTAVTDADAAAKARTGRLYDAIDPDGNLTGNAAPVVQAANDIVGEMSPTSMPMSGAEADIFNKAQALPQLVPARDLIELSKYTNAVMKKEMRDNGATPTYGRLSRFRSALQNNIDSTISDRVSAETEAVKNGHLNADDTLSARLKAEADEWKTQRSETGRAVGSDADQSIQTRTSAISSETGAESAPEQRPGDAPGSEGIQSHDAPTFDEAAAARLAKASKSHADRKQTFGVSPVSDITKSSGMKGQYTLPNGSVPGKVFFPGPKGFQSVQAVVKANPETLPIIEDYAAMSLRRAALSNDGTIDPAKFNRWAAAHKDALRALPEATRARFSTAAEATNALAEAMAGRSAALKEAQTSALREVSAATAARKSRMTEAQRGIFGRFGNLREPEDVTKAVGAIFTGKTPVADMKEIASAVENNPVAKAGLRQSVADYVAKQFTSNTEAGTTGIDQIKSDQFQTFMKKNKTALSHVLTPDEISSLERISADLKQSNRSVSAVRIAGSPGTAQDLYGAANRSNQTVLDRILSEAAAASAGAGGFTVGGPLGAALGWLGVKTITAARASGFQKVGDLMAAIVLNPDLAGEVLRRAPAKINSGQSELFATRLRRIGAATAAARLGQENRQDSR